MTQEKNGQTREARPAGTSDISLDVKREEGPRRVEWERATILNGMSEQVVYQDTEMRIVWANRAAAESVGLAPEDLVGRHCYELRHQRSEPCTNCPVAKARETGRPQSGEMVSPKGAVWSVQGVPIRDAKGNVECIVEVALDITDRKRAEEAARRRTHELGERFKELTCLRRLSNLLQNPGISLEETLQETTALLRPAWQYPKTACGRITLEGREFATANFRETRWRQSCDIVVHGERSGIVEVCYLEERPESDEGPFLKQERILIDAIAERLGRVVERRRTEEALRTSEATYRSIFNATNDGILVLDMETGEIVDANATFCNVFGYTPEELRHLQVDGVSSGEAPYVQEDALRLIHQAAGGQPQRFEWLAKSSEDALLWIDVTLKRASIAGQDRVLAVGRDITERKRAEEALRASEATYRSIFNATNDGILVHDIETGEIVDANAAFLDRHGYAPDEARRLKLGDFMSREAPYRQEDALRSIRKAAGGQPQRFEWLSKDRNGSRLWLDLTMKRATIAGQDRVLAISRDITEHKRADDALRESEAKFRRLAETGAAAIFIYRGTRPLYANAEMERLTGYTRDEILARELWQFVHPEFQSLVRERSRARQQGERVPSRYEFKMVRKSGEERWVDFTAGMIDFEGQPSALGTAYDITEHKRAEEALRESEERFRTLSDASFEGIVIHRKGTILEANQALAAMFGYELSAVTGTLVLDFTAPESRDAVLHNIVSGYEGPYEAIGLKKDGSKIAFEVCARAIRYRGEVARVVALRDITERRRAEEALQKAREELENRVERQMERGNSYGLTFRELTVLHLVAAGQADKEIASHLGISPLTAHKHLGNILAKMSAASRTEAGVRALREGLLD